MQQTSNKERLIELGKEYIRTHEELTRIRAKLSRITTEMDLLVKQEKRRTR